MIERQCVHEVHVSKAMNIYLLGVRIHWGEIKVTMYNFIQCSYRALNIIYGS